MNTTPRPARTCDPISVDVRDRAVEVVCNTRGVWRTYPLGGWFTNVEVDGRALYVRVNKPRTAAWVGDALTPAYGVRVEARAPQPRVADVVWQLAGRTPLA